MFKKHPFAIISITILLAAGIFWTILYLLDFSVPEEKITYGVTFSKAHAEALGLNWKETLTAALDDLGIRHFRLAAYWDDIEPTDDHFAFEDLDWQVNEITKRGGTIIMGVGERLPGWPECHTPDWAQELERGEQQQKIMQMLPVVISQYENNPAIIRWQVENEPLLPSVERCAPPDENFFKKELALVERMDQTRPLMTTVSGEFGPWEDAGQYVDVLGASLYRTVWKSDATYSDYPFPPAFYKLRAETTRDVVPRIVLSELQAEPWLPGQALDAPRAEQYRPVNAALFEKTLGYARKTGFDEIYFSGVEWWYWLKTKHNESAIWDVARPLFPPEANPPLAGAIPATMSR
ncbi:MAG: beta-galactosidase [Candidatus Magasanikbacteria bacterium]|nr:beta-galactosidase [Candidatus Magasanikbacteria bacterium]